MVTHLAFIIRNGEKQKTPTLNNKERRKAKSTQKKQKHTYLIDGRTYISNIIKNSLRCAQPGFCSLNCLEVTSKTINLYPE